MPFVLPSGSVTVTQGNATDIEEDREEEKERDKIDYKGIVNTFNSVCVSFPSVKVIREYIHAALLFAPAFVSQNHHRDYQRERVQCDLSHPSPFLHLNLFLDLFLDL